MIVVDNSWETINHVTDIMCFFVVISYGDGSNSVLNTIVTKIYDLHGRKLVKQLILFLLEISLPHTLWEAEWN